MTLSYILYNCWATFALFIVFTTLFYTVSTEDAFEPTNVVKVINAEVGKEIVLSCTIYPPKVEFEWRYQDQVLGGGNRWNITKQTEGISINVTTKELTEGNENKNYTVTHLSIGNVTSKNAGNYTCLSRVDEVTRAVVVPVDLGFGGRLVNKTGVVRENATTSGGVELKCLFELYKDDPIKWWKRNELRKTPLTDFNQTRISPKLVETIYKIGLTTDDNGTYVCEVIDSVNGTTISGDIDVLVYHQPKIEINTLIAIGSTKAFLNWTVYSYNSEIERYELMTWIPKPGAGKTHYRESIPKNATSIVLDQLEKAATTTISLLVRTKHGVSPEYHQNVTTLEADPNFVPNISINGFSATSVTIGWQAPPPEIASLIHYYYLEATKKDDNTTRKAYHSRDSRNLPYMFDNLEPHSTYVFQVRACSDYTKSCGEWSQGMEAATLDGIPGEPRNVNLTCMASQIYLTWDSPLKPNAEIKAYTLELTGNATYKDRYGVLKETSWGPLAKFMTNDSRSVRFDDLQPNTEYKVRVSAMTRTRRRGVDVTATCRTPPAPPAAAPRPKWRKIMENDKYMFKMYLPRISERNGPFCCYRVYMVRLLANSNWKNLPMPNNLNIVDNPNALATHQSLGAYVTDIFSNEKFPPNSELIMGDGISYYPEDDPMLKKEECQRCLKKPKRAAVPTERPVLSTTPVITTTAADDGIEDEPARKKRSNPEDDNYTTDPIMVNKRNPVEEDKDLIKVYDGPLDPGSNYTLFVELIPASPQDEPVYSVYVNTLMPAPSPAVSMPSTALEIVLQSTCAVAAVVLIGMIIFCVMHSRRSRKVPHAHVEMNPIQQALRYVVGHIGGRSPLTASPPPDMPPIAREDLAAAYIERQADSDYGFQKEFELLQMLPECFPDRTTHASEARENQPKNRYPDIKAYDQTRVKLSLIDGVAGSDYINANYVMGYKDPSEPNQERKQFICAQGPTDATVNDFWRMIWEQRLELIVMLTNLEEYSKVKCSRYWPDDTRLFGRVKVTHVSETRYSDYIVRELKITKQPLNSEGQPIVENNGVSKRNGDCKDASDSSAPTSPREAPAEEARTVRQYHFLMWKDFAAPEYPHSILKFIKRVNEAWSLMVGRPVVVHCSAGVGRTGTLVALDCLLDQLQASGQASVFNTVAELRRQRNFLVQSLKQYVFVYRALVEFAHYGDTEIPARRLKSSIDRLRNTPEGADKCLMEIEFEKMMNAPIPESVKSCSAGSGEELRSKNRSMEILPYDRNRVILTPMPSRECSTYINASFIEAYDNSEGFIITQDPLPNTIMDFWRMVSEHNVATIVMLSEMGEGKCPRYWDDGTSQHEHISVHYENSESSPYYIRRQFHVTNTKSGETSPVRQLQYQGWPTAAGHVPEVTRGLADLATAALQHAPQVILTHCNFGTERSALFVALCNLIVQLRTERRVDVCVVARKVRAQRANTINTFLQYEFLHRAILNYAELHNLLEDS